MSGLAERSAVNVGHVALVLDLGEVELRLEAGESMDAIAADLGVTPRTIRNRFHAAGRPLATQRRRLHQQRRLEDPEWLRDQYVEQARSPSSIAEALGVSTAEVVATLESFGIERPPVHPELTGSALRSAFADGETVSPIARAAGVVPRTVRRELRRHGVENPLADRGCRPALLDDVDWLHAQYAGAGRSMQSIADEVGAHQQTVKWALLRHSIERPITPPKRVEVRAAPSRRIEFDPDWLRQRHDIDRMSCPSIAAEVGVSSHTIRRRFYATESRRSTPTPPSPAGVCTTAVHRAMEFHGIARRSSGKRYREMTDVEAIAVAEDTGHGHRPEG